MANGFFSGRNGSDALSVFLTALALIAATAASVITSEMPRYIVSGIAIVLVAVAAWRMLSTNTAKRRNENEKFLSLFRSGKDPEKARRKEEERQAKAKRKEDEKTHAYFKCPECGKELRVPKGKGKIRITCPHCSHQFIKKT
ncbi:MAG: hypothetical protein IAA97_02375 [Spirochaetes bacterium]|uniref:Zn-finger containing protein n=1 Tax=Candidatus Ornithospirochaeta stercoripullorum TaxID=2840899 RepID=A0A9D9E0A0_9SPIO|nr:hypothetical protein [Candidatus Ornithospirochaeta stercoripullorum]